MATDKENKPPVKDYEYDTLTNERLIADHDYDGIRELDNDLPPWWKWLFYITIVFAVVYMIRLTIFHSDDLIQEREYAIEMENAAGKTGGGVQLVLLQDEASLASGKETWDKICAVCHLPDGGGLVGPNMTDNFWIHGNTIPEQFKIITYGVIQKGMQSYENVLSEQKRLEVISYVMVKLQGTTPANPKAPEGDEY